MKLIEAIARNARVNGMDNYFVEITDTFCGEANYSFARRYQVKANTARGALQKVQKVYGGYWRADYGTRDSMVYREKSGNLIMFVNWVDAEEAKENVDRYSQIMEIK